MTVVYVMGSVVGVLLFVVVYLAWSRAIVQSDLLDAEDDIERLTLKTLQLEKELQNARIRKKIDVEAAAIADDELVERMRHAGYYRR